MMNRCQAVLSFIALMLAGPGQAQVVPPTVIQVPSSPGFVPSDDPRSYEPRDTGRNFFSTDVDAARKSQQQLQQRLDDPQQRSELRASVQKDLKQSHPELARILRIDATLERKLFELLTDHAMEQQAQNLARTMRGRDAKSLPGAAVQARQPEGLQGDQIRALLGAERAERFYYYRATRHLRRDLSEFTRRLGPGNGLRTDQEQRLMQLLQELELRFWRRFLSGRSSEGVDRDPFMDDAMRQLRQQRLNIEKNERVLRAKEQAADLALERVAQFLTPAQLQVYAQWEADKLNRRRSFVQKLRAAAGLNPDIPEATEAEAAVHRQVSGKLRLTFTVSIDDGAPQTQFLVGESDSTLPFVINGDLTAEARPLLFANGEVYVLLRWFERGQVLDLPLDLMGLEVRPATLRSGNVDMSYSFTLQGIKHRRLNMQIQAVPLSPPSEEPFI
jgi:hypothetical protein